MTTSENKKVVSIEEVINQGRLERADDLVAIDFLEHDPLPANSKGGKV
jgi:predicted SnoaL-like aldol condensation-catalyzing enzyme